MYIVNTECFQQQLFICLDVWGHQIRRLIVVIFISHLNSSSCTWYICVQLTEQMSELQCLSNKLLLFGTLAVSCNEDMIELGFYSGCPEQVELSDWVQLVTVGGCDGSLETCKNTSSSALSSAITFQIWPSCPPPPKALLQFNCFLFSLWHSYIPMEALIIIF